MGVQYIIAVWVTLPHSLVNTGLRVFDVKTGLFNARNNFGMDVYISIMGVGELICRKVKILL